MVSATLHLAVSVPEGVVIPAPSLLETDSEGAGLIEAPSSYWDFASESLRTLTVP
jgi:hypothetical protein